MRGKEYKEVGVEKYPVCRLQQTNERDRDGEISRGRSDFSGVIFLMRVGKMEEGPWYCFGMRKGLKENIGGGGRETSHTESHRCGQLAYGFCGVSVTLIFTDGKEKS